MSGYALSRNHQTPQGLLFQLSNHVAFITNVIAGKAIRENVYSIFGFFINHEKTPLQIFVYFVRMFFGNER